MLNLDNIIYGNQVGVYGNARYVDGFISSKYKQTLQQIREKTQFLKILFTLDFVANITFITYLLLCDIDRTLFYFIISNVMLFTMISLVQCQEFQTMPQPVYRDTKSKLSILLFLYTIFQLNFIPFFKFCKQREVEFKIHNKNIHETKLQYEDLICWFSLKKNQIMIKNYMLFFYILIRSLIEESADYSNKVAFFIFFLVLSTVTYICIQHIHLLLFVFQTKFNFAQSALILIESVMQLLSGLCYSAVIVYNPIMLSVSYCVLVINFIVLRCSAQIKGFFNPFYIDILQLIFFGSKMTYLVPLYYSDINQSEIIFNNNYNRFSLFIANTFIISANYFVFFYQSDSFPTWLINFQTVLIIPSLVMLVFKIILIRRLYFQTKSYYVTNLSSLQNKNLNRKCKIKLEIQQRIEEKDWEQIKELLSNESQQLYISIQGQFRIQKILGYSLLIIENMESDCLKQVFTYLLSKSIYMNVNMHTENEILIPNKRAIQFLFSSLSQISIDGQNKIDIENSALVKYFKNAQFYKELITCILQNGEENIRLHSIAFNKHLSHFQYINAIQVLYDLYDF